MLIIYSTSRAQQLHAGRTAALPAVLDWWFPPWSLPVHRFPSPNFLVMALTRHLMPVRVLLYLRNTHDDARDEAVS